MMSRLLRQIRQCDCGFNFCFLAALSLLGLSSAFLPAAIQQMTSASSEVVQKELITNQEKEVLAAEAKAKQKDEDGSWPLFRGNRASTGVATTTLPDDLGKNLKVLWEYSVRGGGFEGTPIVVRNKSNKRKTVYVGDMDGEVVSIDLETGKVNWKFDTGLGISASPAYHNGRVFIGDIDGIFWCLDESGKVLWKFQTDGEISGSANFFGDNVLFGSQDFKLYLLRQKDGEKVWEFETPDQIQCSATVADGKGFVAGCDAFLHLIDLKKGKEVGKVEIHSPTRSTPAVDGGMAVFGTEQAEFFAINLGEVKMEWAYAANQGNAAVRGSAAISKGNVIFGARNRRVYCVDKETGATRWTATLKSKIDASPVIVGDRVFVGSTDGRLYALGLKDGAIVWEKQFRGGFLSSPAVAFERLIVATDRGVVYCLGSDNQ